MRGLKALGDTRERLIVRTAIADMAKVGGVDRECGAAAEARDEPASERRTDQPEGERADELVERVRLCQLLGIDDLRHDRVESGHEEGCADAVDGDDRRQLSEGECVRERERRQPVRAAPRRGPTRA